MEKQQTITFHYQSTQKHNFLLNIYIGGTFERVFHIINLQFGQILFSFLLKFEFNDLLNRKTY